LTAKQTMLLAAVVILLAGGLSAVAVRMIRWGPHTESISLSDTGGRVGVEIGRPLPDVTLVDLDGTQRRLDDARGKIVVLLVHGNACPCSEAYVDRLNSIVRDFGPQGVELWAFNPNANETPEESREYAGRIDLHFPVAHDPESKVADLLLAACMTETWVVDREGILRYHGRIDDNIFKPDLVTSTDLRDALDALVAGRPVPEPETVATGCTIRRPDPVLEPGV
jgi:peroxiredoxin